MSARQRVPSESARGQFRWLVAVLGFAASLAASAQQPGRVYRVGYLSIGSAATTYTRPLEAFRQRLRELGWDEGRNLRIEFRYAEGSAERLPALADELVRLNVDVIVAAPTPAAQAAKNATPTIPIVGTSLTEPVAVGLVSSLARPGGNVTGLTYGVDTEIFGKQLQLLKEVVPGVRRVAVLSNPGASSAKPLVMDRIKGAARSLGLTLRIFEVREPGEFDAAFGAMVRERADALLVAGDPIFFIHRHRLADLALKSRLPSMSTQAQWVEAGGLVSYAPSFPEMWRRAATYIDRILRGARPAELPIEQPAKFELVINQGTARRLGINLSHSVLQRADELIQ